MFKAYMVLFLCLTALSEVLGNASCVGGSARLLKQLWPGAKLTSSWGPVLDPRKTEADESMPDHEKNSPLSPLSDTWRGTIRSVNSSSGSNCYVAITLDYCELCTNINGYQSQVIKYLRKESIPATLFISGKWMHSHSEITQQLIVDPLFEIGNHAWSHANMAITPVEMIDQQVLATQMQYKLLRDQVAQKALEIGLEKEMGLIPEQPILFRLPYGRCNEMALQRLQHLGLKVVQWNHIGVEGQFATEKECETFVNKVQSGSIILLHGNNVPKHTLNFLERVIPLLRKKGFKFLTVSKLLETGSAEITQEGYFSKPGDNLSLDSKFGFLGTGARK